MKKSVVGLVVAILMAIMISLSTSAESTTPMSSFLGKTVDEIAQLYGSDYQYHFHPMDIDLGFYLYYEDNRVPMEFYSDWGDHSSYKPTGRERIEEVVFSKQLNNQAYVVADLSTETDFKTLRTLFPGELNVDITCDYYYGFEKDGFLIFFEFGVFPSDDSIPEKVRICKIVDSFRINENALYLYENTDMQVSGTFYTKLFEINNLNKRNVQLIKLDTPLTVNLYFEEVYGGVKFFRQETITDVEVIFPESACAQLMNKHITVKGHVQLVDSDAGHHFATVQLTNPELLSSNVQIDKTYEEYFADNIHQYINQITRLELPHDIMAKEAQKNGAAAWSLFVENFYGKNVNPLKGGDPGYYYRTVMTDILLQKYASDKYYDTLLKNVEGAANSAAGLLVKQIQKDANAEVDSAKGIDRILKEHERDMVNIDAELYDDVKSVKDVVKRGTDIATAYSEFKAMKTMSEESKYALDALRNTVETQNTWLHGSLNYIIGALNESTFENVANLYIADFSKSMTNALIKDLYSVNPQLKEAMSLANFSRDVAKAGADLIYPVTNSSENMLRMESVYVIESFVQEALRQANADYLKAPSLEKAKTVVGLYDLLMSVYDYGISTAEVAAKYHYEHGISGVLNNVKELFRDEKSDYESFIEWINSYQGALNDVKWYRTKTEIEYGFVSGQTVPLTIITYHEGKVVDARTISLNNGEIYYPKATIINLPFFKDKALLYGDCYTDKGFTNYYYPQSVTSALVLYRTLEFFESPDVFVNGKKIDFPDQRAIIANDRTLVPARGVFEAMGATVTWNESSQKVSVKLGDTISELQIGNKIMKVNDMDRILDVPAALINDRTMIPVRAVAEAFSYSVVWDEENKRVMIDKQDPLAEIVGIYKGSYFATQGETGLTLTVYEENGQYKAIFDFYNLPGRSNARNGSYYMRVGYDETNDTYFFKAYEWIVKPSTYVFVDLNGTYNNGALSGTAPYKFSVARMD